MIRDKEGSDRVVEAIPALETLEEIVVSGKMGIGKEGNPVTISVMDEITFTICLVCRL